MNMFCYQCEQTMNGTGCTIQGVCGKDPKIAALIDNLVYGLKGMAQYAHRARQLGVMDKEINVFTIEALFSTITNVNFDPERYLKLFQRLGKLKEKAKKLYLDACAAAGNPPEEFNGYASWLPATDVDGLVAQGLEIGIETRKKRFGDDITGLQELITYGLKGIAAYADHAHILGYEDERIYAFIYEALDYLTSDTPDVSTLFAMALKTGEINILAMELLDKANTTTFGDPVPTKVRVTPVKGKCIVVSGHDYLDLLELLKQTEGKGINVYTHGEMLPAHGYPGLHKYPHLVGNYGGAWQNQQVEFPQFPGAIVMTTNCIQRPQSSYKDRIFTTDLVAWPGVVHIPDRNFAPVIAAALAAEGFPADEPEAFTTVGFARNAILGVADKVIAAVKNGAIKHFFLIGGCDGAKPGRNYFTEFAESVPKDCVILTLACGKYRFNKLEFGDIGGIPRFLDCGQCNDAYSAIVVAQALADAFNCGVNDLPLSLIVSWYEQKAVAVLLALLALGIRDIRLGPSLPAFVTPAMLKVLVDKFNIMPIGTAKEDLAACLA
jgi:hydroxylamine reductase